MHVMLMESLYLATLSCESRSTVKNPVGVAKLLLAFGATPQAVPADMWQNYLEQPSSRAPDHDGELDPVARWRTAHDRLILESALNLSIRYYLHKASQISIAKQRGVQLAQAHSYLALLKVPYLIIGQDYATKRVLDVVSTHLGMQVASPLVLVFPGLSGHGKTELAKQMGNLLQLPMTIIDCAQIHSQIALFGSRLGYQGNSQGSQLNNHLAEHSGARSVVFLDGFDKTDRDVHNSLLLLLDSGEYHDHRNNKPVDASKTIWIMATNLEDREITNFYRNHLENGTPGQKADAPYSNLTEQLKSRFRDVFGPPMAGRRKNVAPFFPFDKNEQAVVVHKFILELVEQVRNPIDTSCFSKHYPGHVHLALKNDGKLCAHLAGESYIEELGARSLIAGIDDVRIAFFTSFTDTDELVSDGMNDGALMKFTAQLQPFSREDDEGSALGRVIVARDGYTSYYAGQGTEDADTGSDDGVDGLNDTLFKMMGDDIDL